jgi:hypothetical protein
MIFRAIFFTFIVLISDAILASEVVSWTNKQNAGEQQAGYLKQYFGLMMLRLGLILLIEPNQLVTSTRLRFSRLLSFSQNR